MIQLNKKGFTIIELMFAMTAVSLLMLSIATLTIFMKDIMVKGNTYRELNSASRNINNSLLRAFNSISLSGWDGQMRAAATAGPVYYVKTAQAGAFCTGSFSYLWNDDSVLMSATAVTPIRYSGATTTDKSIRFIKVADNSMQYCDPATRNTAWVTVPRDSSVNEVLSSGETNMMLYDINFSRIATDNDTGQSLINISYILGTGSGAERITVSGGTCNPSSDENYCAINNFNVTVRTIGR